MGSKTPVAPPHPHVTVDDVWHGALPKETQMVAGAAGMRREVVWCTALRARPPAFTPLRGGELLLINPHVLSAVDGRLTLARLLESLAGQGVAGAAVSGRVSVEARRVADAHGLPLFALPVGLALDQVEQQVLRYVVDRRAELHERAQDLHRLAVARGAHACAIELARARAARDARDEAEEELLDALTAGRPGSHEPARERAKRKGFDVDAPYLVVTADAAASGKAARIRGAWERQLAVMRSSALVRDRGATTIALISLAGRRAPEPKALVDQLHRAARAATAAAVAVGYGAVRSGATGVASAAREAEQALTMGRRLFGPDSATAVSDLGLYRLLYALQPLPELRDFRDQALASLHA